jgi:hypothetical protein
MSSTYNPGRVAGCLYLLLGFSVVRPIYVAGKLIVPGNAAATLRNIATHELLFRAGMTADVLAGISCIVVALALYELLNEVDRRLGVLMVILGGVMPCTIDCLNVLNDLAALLAKPDQTALAMLFLRIHDYGYLINNFFAGLWLWPLGVLIYRSRFMPRWIGVALVINGFAYLAIAFTGLLEPNYADRVSKIVAPALAGEGALMLWLLIKGARPTASKESAESRA